MGFLVPGGAVDDLAGAIVEQPGGFPVGFGLVVDDVRGVRAPADEQFDDGRVVAQVQGGEPVLVALGDRGAVVEQQRMDGERLVEGRPGCATGAPNG